MMFSITGLVELVIHLVILLIVGPEHSLVHKSSGTILELSYFGTKIPLSKNIEKLNWNINVFEYRCNYLSSKNRDTIVLSSKCNIGNPVWSANDSMQLQLALFLRQIDTCTLFPHKCILRLQQVVSVLSIIQKHQETHE